MTHPCWCQVPQSHSRTDPDHAPPSAPQLQTAAPAPQARLSAAAPQGEAAWCLAWAWPPRAQSLSPAWVQRISAANDEGITTAQTRASTRISP